MATVIEKPSSDLEQRAAKLHERAIVIDGMAVRVTDPPSTAGGVTAIVVNIAGSRIFHDLHFAAKSFSEHFDYLDYFQDRVLSVRQVSDIERAKRDGRLGLICTFQGIGPLGADLGLVRFYAELGMRTLQLTYMEHTLAGSGCFEPVDQGLTSFGRQLIRAMERVGVLLDLAHVGRKTAMDAMKFSRNPVVFSHNNPAALFETPRNTTDEEIRACAGTGGLIAISPSTCFYVKKTAPRPTVVDQVNHITYVAEMVGIDHIGLAYELAPNLSPFKYAASYGRDYDATEIEERPYQEKRIVGGESRAGFPNVTLEMMKRGFSDDDILKVLGGNWVRVFGEAWRPRHKKAEPARSETPPIAARR